MSSFSSCQIRDCMRFSIVCPLLASSKAEGGFICGESLKGDRDILSQLGKVTLHLYLITFCATYLLAFDANVSVLMFYIILLEVLPRRISRCILDLYMACDCSLEKTVFAPCASEAGWNDWEIGNPDQSTQQTCLRRIKEACAGKCLPLRLVQEIMGF